MTSTLRLRCWEQSLFDNMVYDRVREILRPDDFYAMNHQKLFQHMAAMIESGKTADRCDARRTLHDRW